MSENLPKPTRAEIKAQKEAQNLEMKTQLRGFEKLLQDYKSQFNSKTPRSRWSPEQTEAWTKGNAKADELWEKYGGEYGPFCYPFEFKTDSDKSIQKILIRSAIGLFVASNLWSMVPRVLDPESSRPVLTCYEEMPSSNQKEIQCIRNKYKTNDFIVDEIKKNIGGSSKIVISNDSKKVEFVVPASHGKNEIQQKLLEQIAQDSSL